MVPADITPNIASNAMVPLKPMETIVSKHGGRDGHEHVVASQSACPSGWRENTLLNSFAGIVPKHLIKPFAQRKRWFRSR